MRHNFSPLGSTEDLPGDPGEMRRLAQRYADTADEIVKAAERLRQVGGSADGVWRGLAGRSFPSKAMDLSSRIRKAEARYRRTAEALSFFADKADMAQADAGTAAHKARMNHDYFMATLPLPAAVAPPMQADMTAARTRQDDNDYYSGQVAQAGNDFATAKSHYDAAARQAHDAIHQASHEDGLRDSWWYRNWQTFVKALAIISMVVLIIALVIVAAPVLLGAAGITMAAGLAAGLATASTVVEATGAVLAVGVFALDVDGRIEGHDVSTRTLVLDGLAIATFGLSKFVLAPRIAGAMRNAKSVAIEETAARAGAKAMTEFEDLVDAAPSLGSYLRAESLRPLAELRALGKADHAVQGLESSLKLASQRDASLAVRMLLREAPDEIRGTNALLALATHSPQAFARAQEALRLQVLRGVSQTVTDGLVSSHVVHDWIKEAKIERHVEGITGEVRRHLLHLG